MNEQQRSSSTMSDRIQPQTIPYLYDGSKKYGYAPRDVTEVIVKDTVTELRDCVFALCTALTSITIPNSVIRVGDRVFMGCTALTSITIPNSVINLGNYVFKDCKALTSAKIHATVSALDNRTFHDCTALQSITLPDTVTTIESYTFYGLKSLKSVALPPSLEIIGDYAFAGCESLVSIAIPPSVTTIGHGVFARCVSLSTIVIPDAIESIGNGLLYGCKSLANYDDFLHEQASETVAMDGPGPQLGFKGKPQRGYGPEWCGISLKQIQDMKAHPHYRNLKYLMRDYVRDIVEPYTDGTGVSYALLKNRKSPLKAKVMVSHAWDESIRQFVEAIERLKEEGPFWVCALSIYQNSDPDKGVTIGDQLGPDPEYGPFATILREVDLMLAVLTEECDIYTRLWCVYEIYFAVGVDVKVKLAPHIGAFALEYGNIHEDICVNQAENRVKSEVARCGAPNTPMNDDEIAIRKIIDTLGKGFKSVDETVERIRLIHLVSYPMHDIKLRRATARDTIKDAIECILPCFPEEYDLKHFDEFLSEKLSSNPGFERTPRGEDENEVKFNDHDYYITKGDEKHDVFQQWSSSILHSLSKSQV